MRKLPINPRRFLLWRDKDITGVSGTGCVAEGVVFSDGVVALRWRSDWPTSVVFYDRGIEAVEAVHGHSGATEIDFLDNAPIVSDMQMHEERRDALAAVMEQLGFHDQPYNVADTLENLLDRAGYVIVRTEG